MNQTDGERLLQQAILADKASLSERLDQLLASPAGTDHRDDLRSFHVQLGAHHLAIEEVLYPALMVSEAPADDLAVAQAAHEVCEHCVSEALSAASSRSDIVRPHLLALRSLWDQWPAGLEARPLKLAQQCLTASKLSQLARSYQHRVAELGEELAHSA